MKVPENSLEKLIEDLNRVIKTLRKRSVRIQTLGSPDSAEAKQTWQRILEDQNLDIDFLRKIKRDIQDIKGVLQDMETIVDTTYNIYSPTVHKGYEIVL